MARQSILHGSAAARAGMGVLLLGPSGAGKSDLLLRLIDRGFSLIADDQVVLDGLMASPPPSLAGLVEHRGLGVLLLPFAPAPLVLVVQLEPPERLPAPRHYADLDLPVISVESRAASAPLTVALALDCLLGLVPMNVGAFA